MADYTPDRIGQVNQSGDVNAIFLKLFLGEVLTAFNANNISMDKHIVRNITNG